MEKYQDLFDLFAQQMDAIVKACEPFYMGHGGSGVTDEQIKEAAFKNANEFPHYFTETSHNVAFHYGATWANDQNTARIAELEAMLSKSAFNLDGHIILLQAANQQIEKERKRIAELEAQKEELIKLLERIQLSVQNPYVSLPDFEYNSITEMLHKYPPKKNA